VPAVEAGNLLFGMLPMEDEAPALVGQIEQELTIAAGQRAAFSVIPLICSDFISFSCARICFLHLSPGNQRTATAGERKERIQGAVGDGNRVTRVREWRDAVPAPICSVRVGTPGGGGTLLLLFSPIFR